MTNEDYKKIKEKPRKYFPVLAVSGTTAYRTQLVIPAVIELENQQVFKSVDFSFIGSLYCYCRTSHKEY